MASLGASSLEKVRETIRQDPAVALIAGAILGPPPGLDPPLAVRRLPDENS